MLLVLQSQDKQVGSTASGSTATPRHGLVYPPSPVLAVAVSVSCSVSVSVSISSSISHLCSPVISSFTLIFAFRNGGAFPHCCRFSPLISCEFFLAPPPKNSSFLLELHCYDSRQMPPGNDIRHGLPRSAKQLCLSLCVCLCVCLCVLVTCGSTSVRHFQLQLPAWPLRGSLSTAASATASSPAPANCSNPCPCHVRRQFWVAASLLAVPR